MSFLCCSSVRDLTTVKLCLIIITTKKLTPTHKSQRLGLIMYEELKEKLCMQVNVFFSF